MKSRIEIYSANQDSWLEVDQGTPVSYYTTQPNCSVIVKGFPYRSRNYMEDVRKYSSSYLKDRNHHCQSNVIAAIDPHTGLYKEIPYPQIVLNQDTSVHPFNLMDSLAVLIYSPCKNSKNMLHVYELDESRATWIIKYTIGLALLQLKNICIFRYFEDAGKTLVVGWNLDRDCNFFYDPKTDCLCDSIGLDAFQPRWDESYHHVESLVCINGMELIRKEEDDNNDQHGGLKQGGRELEPPF